MGFLDYEGLKLFKTTLTDNFCANSITSATTITKGDGFDVKGARVLYDGCLLGDAETDSNTKSIWLGDSLTNEDVKKYSCLDFVFYDGSYAVLKNNGGHPHSFRWYDPEPGTSIFLHCASWTTSSGGQNQLYLKTAELALSPIATADTSPALLVLHPAYEIHSSQPTTGTSVTSWDASTAAGLKWSIALQKVIAWA